MKNWILINSPTKNVAVNQMPAYHIAQNNDVILSASQVHADHIPKENGQLKLIKFIDSFTSRHKPEEGNPFSFEQMQTCRDQTDPFKGKKLAPTLLSKVKQAVSTPYK